MHPSAWATLDSDLTSSGQTRRGQHTHLTGSRTQRGTRRPPREPWLGRWAHPGVSLGRVITPAGLESRADVHLAPTLPCSAVQKLGVRRAAHQALPWDAQGMPPKRPHHHQSRRREGEARTVIARPPPALRWPGPDSASGTGREKGPLKTRGPRSARPSHWARLLNQDSGRKPQRGPGPRMERGGAGGVRREAGSHIRARSGDPKGFLASRLATGEAPRGAAGVLRIAP